MRPRPRKPTVGTEPGRPRDQELAWGAGVLLLGVSIRALFVATFPTRAMLDAYEIIDFGRRIAQGVAFDRSAKSLWLWAHWNPGLPAFLAPLFAWIGGTEPAVAAAARWSLALAGGAVGIIPFLVLRDVVSLRVRALVAVLLALWPGHAAFSGVVLQDNPVVLPTVLLACLTLRSGALGRSFPIASAAAFAAGIALRQETLGTNLLLAVVPLGLTPLAKGHPGRRIAGLALLAGALLALATVRWRATDRFAVSSDHSGTTVLGAFAPGAGLTGYVDYHALASTYDARFVDGQEGGEELRKSAWRMVSTEALRRPAFHAVRALGSVLYNARIQDIGGLWWTFGTLPAAAEATAASAAPPTSPGAAAADDALPWTVLDASRVLPASRQPLAARTQRNLLRMIRLYQPLLHVLFFAAMVVAARMRWGTVLLVGGGYLARLAFHGATVIQPRFLLVGTALELLAVVAAVCQPPGLRPRPGRRLVAAALLAGCALVAAARWSEPRIRGWVGRHDAQQRSYSFAIVAYRHAPSAGGSWVAARLRCRVEQGTVSFLNEGKATLRLLENDPAPGDRATAECSFEPYLDGAYSVVLHDGYPAGGFPDRTVLRVTAGGSAPLIHDLAATAFAGDIPVPLGRLASGDRVPVRVELYAPHPDPGPLWGAATPVEISVRLEPAGP